MLWLDWKLALVCLAAFPAILYFSRFYRRRAREVYRESRLILGRLNAGLQENIAGWRPSKLSAKKKKCTGAFKRSISATANVLLRSIRYNAVFFPVIEIFSALSIGLLLWYGGQPDSFQRRASRRDRRLYSVYSAHVSADPRSGGEIQHHAGGHGLGGKNLCAARYAGDP